MSTVFIRDRIVIDASFPHRSGLDQAPPGSTLLIAAREVVLAGNVVLDGHDLVLLADRLDGSAGTLTLNNPAVAAIGHQVTVVCRVFRGLSVVTIGAEGGQGSTGETGAEGRPGRPASLPFKPGGPGGRGGRGHTGGRGLPGGPGGRIAVRYLFDETDDGIDPSALQAIGGPGGAGGEGGPGGPGGEGGPGEPDGRNGAEGPQGDTGPVGVRGPVGVTELLQSTEDEYWQTVRPLAAGWAAYRLAMAQFYFRAANPSTPTEAQFLDLARGEAEAVLQLDPGNPAAAALLELIVTNHNPFGLARDFDLIPDFPYFEQVVTDYAPLVLGLFDSAATMLDQAVTIEDRAETLQSEIAHLQGLSSALEAELTAAQLGLVAAASDRDFAKDQAEANERRIQDRRDELARKTLTWDGILGFAGLTILTGLFTLGSGGAGIGAVVAFMPEILRLTGDDSLPFTDKDRTDLLDKARGLKDWTKFFDDPAGSTMPIALSFAKMIKDVNDASGDAELKALLKESIELTHAKLTTQLRSDQAKQAVLAAQAHLDLAAADIVRAQDQLAHLTADEQFVEAVATTLLRGAQGHMDIVMKYAFFAARALEIYTLADLSADVRYDYGYVHPDLEADHRDGLLPLLKLIAAYRTSWARFVGIIAMRNSYDAYFGSGTVVRDKVFLRIDAGTDPARLEQFRQTQHLTLLVDLDDVPPTRFEAKAAYALLSLTGATANVPALSCIVEHSGRWSSRRRNATVAELVLRPRATVVQTAKSGLVFTGAHAGVDPAELSFWGRGVATGWHVFIESDEMTRRDVDLSGLTAIELEIGYDAFR